MPPASTILGAATVGGVLSAVAVGLLGSLGPVTRFPRLAGHSPWADYQALAGSAGISPPATFALTAVICTCTIIVFTWRFR